MGAYSTIKPWLHRLLLVSASLIFVTGNLFGANETHQTQAPYEHLKPLQLHSVSANGLAGEIFHHSAPDEVQRIEEFNHRQSTSRQREIALDSHDWWAIHGGASAGILLAIVFISELGQSNLFSFAHAYLTDRYPIPPPSATR